MDFKASRPENSLWIEEYMAKLGAQEFSDYYDKIEKALDNLEIDKCYNVATQVRSERQDLFVKICCFYIESHHDYYMSDDYDKIYRKKHYEQRKMDTRTKGLCPRQYR